MSSHVGQCYFGCVLDVDGGVAIHESQFETAGTCIYYLYEDFNS